MNRQVATWLGAHRAELAAELTERQFADHPELAQRFGPAGRAKCTEDAAHHIQQLEIAIRRGRPEMLADYLAWARELLGGLGIGAADLDQQLDRLELVLADAMPEPAIALQVLGAARVQLAEHDTDTPSHLDPARPLAPLARRYLSALLDHDRRGASEMILEAVDGGASIRDVYLEVFQPCLWEIGRLWQLNQLTVAQEHFCTAATQMVISQLYPRLFTGRSTGRVVVATSVAGELHEIGVRMVADFFEMEGWDSHYLGASTPRRDVVQTVADRNADLVAISATLTSSLAEVAQLVAALRADPATAGVPVIVGGRAFLGRSELAAEVGAEGTAHDGDSAMALARELVP